MAAQIELAPKPKVQVKVGEGTGRAGTVFLQVLWVQGPRQERGLEPGSVHALLGTAPRLSTSANMR